MNGVFQVNLNISYSLNHLKTLLFVFFFLQPSQYQTICALDCSTALFLHCKIPNPNEEIRQFTSGIYNKNQPHTKMSVFYSNF